MAKIILVTVGTSSIYDHSNWQIGFNHNFTSSEELSEELEIEALNGRTDEFNHQYEQALNTLRDYLIRYYENNKKGLENLSAEIASLLAMEKNDNIGAITDNDKIYLLHSDTKEGELCAEINAGLMKFEIKIGETLVKNTWNVTIFRINSLKITSKTKPQDFINGIRNLEHKIRDLFNTHSNYAKFTVVSGGYKGLIVNATNVTWEFPNGIALYLFEKSSEGIILNRPKQSDDGLRGLSE